MTKVGLFIFIALWTLALPVVILGVGFAGVRLWSPSAMVAEIGNGKWEGFLIRAGILLYMFSPVIVYRSYHKRSA